MYEYAREQDPETWHGLTIKVPVTRHQCLGLAVERQRDQQQSPPHPMQKLWTGDELEITALPQV